ncbi:MAG: MCE family protein, partial [Desulfobulbaceae bacterium]
MTTQTESSSQKPSAASPVIQKKRSISIVWLVPLVALLVGGWLAYKGLTEKGPVITISFETAEGLEVGKTKVKFKDVEVGVVKELKIGKDLQGVVLTVEMQKGAEPYLTENSKFWVVKARVGTSEVSGLSTLLGGVYIGMEPSREGQLIDHFVGLEKPPIVTSDMKGKHFYLNAGRLGSLDSGSPVYFRQIRVGRVVDYKLDDNGANVVIHIFIDSPFDQFVRENSSFWLASGLDLQLTADGLRVDTESVVSMLVGGIAFSSSLDDSIKAEAQENSRFTLYRTRDEAMDQKYTIEEYYYVEIFETIRGLSVGAPVEFRGLRIGSVKEIEARADFEQLEFSTMVKIGIEKERLNFDTMPDEPPEVQIRRMVAKGLRAQLKTGNLLTGQL